MRKRQRKRQRKDERTSSDLYSSAAMLHLATHASHQSLQVVESKGFARVSRVSSKEGRGGVI